MEELLDQLDEAWDDEDGFLGKLRSGTFDPEAGDAYVALLGRIPQPGDVIDARLVQLIWFAPLFMEWQTERLALTEPEDKQLARIATLVQESVENILGIP
ncbi:hypothetical protein [Kitasatospora viridis]|uniref:Uncharacterized protein n=1 Tax=Kitasatospora viridis TaxID=281105 RepID=A0A561UH00_9ACTN|nr:hypothetical protein [Kitasatospora viridis]TWF98648.1 hypothetical protein FHX73_112469 [Kitasatospora viridis]